MLKLMQLKRHSQLLQPGVVFQPIHEAIIQRGLKDHLYEFTPEIQNKIMHAMDELWSMNTNCSNPINLDKTVRTIVARASNRAFVGLPLYKYASPPQALHSMTHANIGRDPVLYPECYQIRGQHTREQLDFVIVS